MNKYAQASELEKNTLHDLVPYWRSNRVGYWRQLEAIAFCE